MPRRAATIIKPARTIDRKVCDGIRNAWCGRGRCREQHKQPRGAAIDQWPPQLNCRIPHRITQVSRLQLRTLTRVQQRCTMRHRHVGDARCDPGLQCAVSRHHVFGELVHRVHQTGPVRAGCTHNTPPTSRLANPAAANALARTRLGENALHNRGGIADGGRGRRRGNVK